jgi:hypothetical protein
VRAPLQRRRDRHEDRVVLPVVQLHQAMDAGSRSMRHPRRSRGGAAGRGGAATRTSHARAPRGCGTARPGRAPDDPRHAVCAGLDGAAPRRPQTISRQAQPR